MNFPRFPNSLKRKGTSADRGNVLNWPPELLEGQRASRRSGSYNDSLFRRLAPGLVTGASDVDPAMVLTATVAGALFGYSLLWVAVLCIPFLLTVFGVSARIGQETRRGLVELLGKNYGKKIALACAGIIVLINMAMIVADLMAVTEALSIILDQRRIFFVAAVAFFVWYVLIFRDYHKITHALAFLAFPLFIYVAAAILSRPPVGEVLRHAFIPSIGGSSDYVTAVVALFGSLLTPYVLVWQTSSRGEGATRGGSISEAEHRMGAFVTTVLSLSIMISAGTVLHGTGLTDELTTRQAALAMQPAVGSIGPVMFSIGIIGAGLVALPILVASLCYSVSEAMGWQYGLSEHPWDAKRFYVLISAALFVAAAVNFVHINPVTALYWSQVLAGAFTVPILLFILLLSNDRRVMKTVNSRWQNFWIGAAAGALCAAGLLVLWWKLRHM